MTGRWRPSVINLSLAPPANKDIGPTVSAPAVRTISLFNINCKTGEYTNRYEQHQQCLAISSSSALLTRSFSFSRISVAMHVVAVPCNYRKIGISQNEGEK